MAFLVDGIEFVPAEEYDARVQKYGTCVVLIIAPDEPQMRLPILLFTIRGDWKYFVCPVTAEDSHLIEVVRVPRIRVYEQGVLKADRLFNKEETAHLEALLRDLKLS